MTQSVTQCRQQRRGAGLVQEGGVDLGSGLSPAGSSWTAVC